MYGAGGNCGLGGVKGGKGESGGGGRLSSGLGGGGDSGGPREQSKPRQPKEQSHTAVPFRKRYKPVHPSEKHTRGVEQDGST